MTEVDLERLIKAWYERQSPKGEMPSTMPNPDCPPLALLWRHYAEGQALDEYEEHVGECGRCRRICEIIERERSREVTPLERRPWTVRRVAAVGAALAAAACIALVFVSWPGRSPDAKIASRSGRTFDAEIAAFAERADLLSETTVTLRGGGEDSPALDRPREPDWIAQVLAEPDVKAAIVEGHPAIDEAKMVFELGQGGGLQLDSDGRVVLAEGMDEPSAKRDGLTDLIERDNAACERIVDALMRHLPDVTEKDRPAVRRSLNRWRAKNVFGRSD